MATSETRSRVRYAQTGKAPKWEAVNEDIRRAEHCAQDVDSNRLHRTLRMTASTDYLIGEELFRGDNAHTRLRSPVGLMD